MKKITITLNDANNITDVAFEGPMTAGIFLDTALAITQLATESLLDKAAEAPDYDENQSKRDRGQIYNLLVVFVSQLCEEIYPEYEELGPTPEELLAKLDEKVKELKDLEQK